MLFFTFSRPRIQQNVFKDVTVTLSTPSILKPIIIASIWYNFFLRDLLLGCARYIHIIIMTTLFINMSRDGFEWPKSGPLRYSFVAPLQPVGKIPFKLKIFFPNFGRWKRTWSSIIWPNMKMKFDFFWIFPSNWSGATKAFFSDDTIWNFVEIRLKRSQ